MSKVVRVPDEVASRLAAEAERLGVSEDDLAARLLADHLPKDRAPRSGDLTGLIGLGSSKEGGFGGRDHKEILDEEFAKKTARDV